MFKLGDKVQIIDTEELAAVYKQATYGIIVDVRLEEDYGVKLPEYDFVTQYVRPRNIAPFMCESAILTPVTLVGEEVIEENVELLGKLADRFNDGKPKLSMIDTEILNLTAQVLEFGEKKYSRDNWKKGRPINDIMDSLLRHAFAITSGEENDPESGLSHLGHIVANAMFIAYYKKEKK